jgi:molecular chaperone GrpE (heat shock protein)
MAAGLSCVQGADAVSAADTSGSGGQAADVQPLLEGVQLTQGGLLRLLATHDVSPITATQGTAFDPHVHVRPVLLYPLDRFAGCADRW